MVFESPVDFNDSQTICARTYKATSFESPVDFNDSQTQFSFVEV